jgi:hypothetical protein
VVAVSCDEHAVVVGEHRGDRDRLVRFERRGERDLDLVAGVTERRDKPAWRRR